MAKSGLQRRFLETHLLIAFAGILFVSVLYISSTFLGKAANKLSDSVSLIPNSVLSLIHGLQLSITANQGWSTVGEERFLEKNDQAWEKIDSSLKLLESPFRVKDESWPHLTLAKIRNKIENLRNLQIGVPSTNAQYQIDYIAINRNHEREFLFDRAVTLTDEIVLLLQQLDDHASSDAYQHRGEITQLNDFAFTSVFIGMVGLVIAAIIISLNNARSMIAKISELSSALQNYAMGDHSIPIPLEGDDEITNLARLFNQMVLAIEEKQSALKRYQNELENRVRQRTKELYRSKELAETTLQSIGDASITVDSRQLITMFNAAAEKLFQLSSAQVIGRPITETLILTEIDQESEELFNPVQACLSEGQVFSSKNTYSLHREESGQISVKVNAAPIAGTDGFVDGVIVIIRDVTTEQALQSELSYRANHDALTGISNRRRFNSELKELMGSIGTDSKNSAVAFLDLDNFKIVNDTAGHAAGDELLRQLASLLKGCVRREDTIARLGGDEFGIILRSCDLEHAERVCESLRDAVANFNFLWGNKTFRVGVSIGVVEINRHSSALSEVLGHADAACYRAKQSGRNTVCVSHDLAEIDTTPNSNDLIIRAFDSRQFSIGLTSLVSFSPSNDYSCREVVATIHYGDTHFLPATYRQVAERYCDTSILDSYILEELLKLFEKAGMSGNNVDIEPVYVQISAAALESTEFSGQIEQARNLGRLPSGVLLFGLSEHLIFENLNQVRRMLSRWSELGIDIVIENCGGNLSAFRFLRELPVKFFSVDSGLTQQLSGDYVNRTVVRAISDLARLSGKRTFAVSGRYECSKQELISLGIDVILGESEEEAEAGTPADRIFKKAG